MLKTRVTMGIIYRVLLNIFNVQRLLLPPNAPAVNIRIFSLVHQLRLLLTLTFFPYLICLVRVTMYINWEEFIYGTFEDCIGLFNSHIGLFNSHYRSFYLRISAR